LAAVLEYAALTALPALGRKVSQLWKTFSQKSEVLPIVIWMHRAATWKLDDQSEMTNSDVFISQEYPLQYLAKAYRAYVKSENLGNCPKGRSQRKDGGECFAQLLCI